MSSSEDEEDLAIVEAIRARGAIWIPADEANALMDQMQAAADNEDLEDAEDAAAAAEWDALKAAGQAVTVTHEQARRRLGLD